MINLLDSLLSSYATISLDGSTSSRNVSNVISLLPNLNYREIDYVQLIIHGLAPFLEPLEFLRLPKIPLIVFPT